MSYGLSIKTYCCIYKLVINIRLPFIAIWKKQKQKKKTMLLWFFWSKNNDNCRTYDFYKYKNVFFMGDRYLLHNDLNIKCKMCDKISVAVFLIFVFFFLKYVLTQNLIGVWSFRLLCIIQLEIGIMRHQNDKRYCNGPTKFLCFLAFGTLCYKTHIN